MSTRPPIRILAVDDDPFGRQVLKKGLESVGYIVETADSGKEARALLEKDGLKSFDCLISDHYMPEMSGLELLEWVRSKDETLSTIIITAEDEKELIQGSLRGGAVDFLQKPIKQSELQDSVAHAIDSTYQRRRLEETDIGVKEASQMNQIFQAIHASNHEKYLRYFMLPTHDVGGDFINLFSIEKSKLLFIIGDVSGHDVRAAFVSAYFQGMVRGLLEMEKKNVVSDILPFFNRILSNEWNNSLKMPTSLSVCVLILDFGQKHMSLASCGLPTPAVTTHDGDILFIHECGHPLGWFADDSFALKEYDCKDWAFLFTCSDGLEDFAKAESMNPFTLTYHLLDKHTSEEEKKALLENATDDVLTMRFQIDTNVEEDTLPQPVFYSRYTSDALDQIDEIHANLETNIKFLFQQTNAEHRLFDFITCCREALINAMKYGCKHGTEEFCEIKITFFDEDRRIRARIDDPGEGHHFVPKTDIDILEETEHFSLGLAIINDLSDFFEQQRSGATLVFDFLLHPQSSSAEGEMPGLN